MAQSRILKLSILADTKDLVSGLNKAQDATNQSSSKISDGLKKVGVALAAAGAAAAAYAGKLIVDGVKAAIEDEAAQTRLATALKNVTGATNTQIAAVEKMILQTSLATGVADDKLRPAFQRLAVATGDTAKATDLLKLSMDISAATGKDLESVTNAVGKAYEGSTTSLGKLGIGLGAADIKALGLEGTMAALNEKFGGAAQAQAETFEGKIARLKVAFDEAKETVGSALLPILSELFEFITGKLVPIFQKLSDDFNNNVRPALERLWKFIQINVLPIFVALGKFIFEELIPVYRNILVPVIEQVVTTFQNLFLKVKDNQASFDELGRILDRVWFFIKTYLAPVIEFVLVQKLKELEAALNFIVEATQKVIDNFEKIIKFIPGLEIALKLLGAAWNATGTEAAYQTEKTQEAAKSWFDSAITAKTEYTPAVKEVSSAFESVTTTTTTATNATKNFTGATKASTEALKEQFTVMQSLDLMRAGFASAVGGVVQPGSANLKPQLPGGETFRSAAELVSQFGGKIVGFNAKPGDPFYGFTKGSTLEGFKPSTGSTNNVTINVNGTVVDPEGTARAIANVITNSVGRAGNLILSPVLGVQ